MSEYKFELRPDEESLVTVFEEGDDVVLSVSEGDTKVSVTLTARQGENLAGFIRGVALREAWAKVNVEEDPKPKPGKTIRCTTPKELFGRVQDFCRAEPGTTILSRDDRRNRVVGFMAEKKRILWAISLPTLRETKKGIPEQTEAFLNTPLGRETIARMLSRGEDVLV
jgi:hypothetical protein